MLHPGMEFRKWGNGRTLSPFPRGITLAELPIALSLPNPGPMPRSPRILRADGRLLPVAVALLVLAPPAQGQADAQRLLQQVTGQQISQEQILERLRASGVSRAEARARLTQAGYDPALVDPYFDRLDGADADLPSADASFLGALTRLGILQAGFSAPPRLRAQPGSALELAFDSIGGDTVRTGDIEVFGRSVFRQVTNQFEPVVMGPVDEDYRLGPGDQVILILTGDVELAYSLDITREGFLVIPDVGQVSVNGLTLASLRDQLFDRLGRVYSGIRRAPDASTRFDVSLGRLRMNQVFVIGDVVRPGAYQISAVGTVLTSLYRAGGPSDNGTFRSIRIQRSGRTVAEVDLYDYLLRGDASRDVRLDQGDVVFVGPAGSQVRLEGQVRRPAIYEIKNGEALPDVVRFAGGVLPDAHVERIQVERILPPSQRGVGKDRVLLDASLAPGGTPDTGAFALLTGDRITVHSVLEETRNRVSIEGAVWRPGAYEFFPGMRVGDLLNRAGGRMPSAFLPTGHVRRRVPETGLTRLVRFSLSSDTQSGGLGLPLEDLDEVIIFDADSLGFGPSVTVSGEVKDPGQYPLDQSATVEDLLLAAGGFTPAADPTRITLARIRRGSSRSDTLSVSVPLAALGGLITALDPAAYAAGGEADLDLVSAGAIGLQDGDEILVRRLAGWTSAGSVVVEGEVLFPGPYPLSTRQDRISQILARAGGLTREANVRGGRLEREGIPVAISVAAALERPGSQADFVLKPGDRVVIPEVDPTVTILGEVLFPSRVAFDPRLDTDGYVQAAGGALPQGDRGRLTVEYPNGKRAVGSKFLFFRRDPRVEPGSTIFIPLAVEDAGTDWGNVLNRVLALSTSVLTVLVLSNQLK